MVEQQQTSAEKPISNGVCQDFCSANGGDCKISSFQMAIWYLRALRNGLEYDTRLLETLRHSCIAYVDDCFAEIVAMCSGVSSYQLLNIEF